MKTNKYPGKYILFEGIDGSGKSEQFNRAVQYLSAYSNVKVVFTKEPTEQPSGREIYQILRGQHPTLNLKTLNRFDFQRLYFKDRIAHYRDFVISNLEKGVHVVSDRGFPSMSYGVQFKTDFTTLMAIQETMFVEEEVLFIWPNAIFIYDVLVEVAMERMKKSGKNLDEFETEKVLSRVRQNYLTFARFYPSCHVIDGTRDSQEVFIKTRSFLISVLGQAEEKAND